MSVDDDIAALDGLAKLIASAQQRIAAGGRVASYDPHDLSEDEIRTTAQGFRAALIARRTAVRKDVKLSKFPVCAGRLYTFLRIFFRRVDQPIAAAKWKHR